MPDETHMEPNKISLKRLTGMLSLGQLWAVIVALIAMIGGAFGFGMFVNELRLEYSYQSKLTGAIAAAETMVKDSVSEEYERRIQGLNKENKEHVLQIEFLERSLSYLIARIRGHEDRLNTGSDELVADTRKQFAHMLNRLYKDGDKNLQRLEGYEFDESEPGNHKIIFRGVQPYRIPSDVKGDFIDQLGAIQ